MLLIGKRALIGILGVLCAAGGATAHLFMSGYTASREAGLLKLFGGVRPIEGRICGLDFAPYNPSSLPRIPPAKFRMIRQKVLDSRRSEPGLRDVALLSLLVGRPKEATTILATAGKRREDACVLTDLAAAYLERARVEEHDAQFLMQAIVACSRALKEDPELLEALFNKALALEAAGLNYGARETWRLYLERDPRSPWAEEARSHLRDLSKPPRRVNWKPQKKRLAEATLADRKEQTRAITRNFPDFVRLYAEEELFGNWAQARLSNRTVQATQDLHVLGAIGNALAIIGGDRLILDTAEEIDTAELSKDEARILGLAKGFALYQQGLARFVSDDFSTASEVFARSFGALHDAGSRSSVWPLLHLAICDYYNSNYGKALHRLRILRSMVNGSTYPAVRGRIEWIIGLVNFAQSDLIQALNVHMASIDLFRRSRETIHEGYAHALVAADLAALGEREEAWRHRYYSLTVLPGVDDPRRIYSILQEASEAAVEEEQFEAALSLFDELLLRIDMQVPVGVLCETLARRAAVLNRLGRRDVALADLARARELLPAISTHDFRLRITADIEVAEADAELAENPRRAAELLSSALEIYSEAGYRAETAGVFARRAAAYEAAGDLSAAKNDLDSGIKDFERRRDSVANNLDKARYFHQVQRLFDARIEMELAPPGDRKKAFAYADRARLRLPVETTTTERSADTKVRNCELREIQRSLPNDTLLIEYLVLRDRVLIWGIGTSVISDTVVVDERTIAKLVSLYREEILAGHLGKRAAARLYEMLIQPVQPLLKRPVHTVVVVPDKFLQGVPFSALVVPETGRFLVENYAVLLSSSGCDFMQHISRRKENFIGRPKALLVDASQVSSSLTRQLPRLPAVGTEINAIAELYPKSLILKGSEATAEHLLANAGSYDVVHFSGHALSEPDPTLSALLLAPGTEASGLLRVRDLFEARLVRTKIVVLGACRTALGSPPRDGGISLALPFLSAGVRAVAASLWNVNDKSTALLLWNFHRLLMQGYPSGEALRRAQVGLLRSGTPEFRSPLAWAGFEIIGADVQLQAQE